MLKLDIQDPLSGNLDQGFTGLALCYNFKLYAPSICMLIVTSQSDLYQSCPTVRNAFINMTMPRNINKKLSYIYIPLIK